MKKKIALAQMNVIVKDVEKNYETVKSLLEEALQSDPDIIVLPETWNTGFMASTSLQELADPQGTRTKDIIGQFAKDHRVNILAGSVATKINDKIYNTSYAFNREGQVIGEYNKMHGFSPAKENIFFTGGKDICKFYFDEVPCSIVTCYDIRFPELVRMAALQNIDLLFVPAQWPTMRLKHWITLNTARAIENQMFLCAVNGCGTIGRAQCAGHSLVIDPWGEEILHLNEKEQVQTASIDLDIIKDIRSKINIFQDRKPELYKF